MQLDRETRTEFNAGTNLNEYYSFKVNQTAGEFIGFPDKHFKDDGKKHGVGSNGEDSRDGTGLRWYQYNIQEDALTVSDGDEVRKFTPPKKDNHQNYSRVAYPERKRTPKPKKEQKKTGDLKKLKAYWENLITGPHFYLEKKRIQAWGTRIDKNILVVPAYNIHGELKTIQKINSEKKSWEKNYEAKEVFFPLKGDGLCSLRNAKTIYFAEGFGTAASIAQGLAPKKEEKVSVIATLSAGGMKSIPPLIRQLNPDAPFILCADNDEPDIKGRFIPLSQTIKGAIAAGNATVTMPKKPEDQDKWDFSDEFLKDGDIAKAINEGKQKIFLNQEEEKEIKNKFLKEVKPFIESDSWDNEKEDCIKKAIDDVFFHYEEKKENIPREIIKDIADLEMKEQEKQEETTKREIAFVEELEAPFNKQDFINQLKLEKQGIPSGYFFKGGISNEPEELIFPSGALTVIAGATGHGKTSFLINISLNLIEKLERPIHIFTFEEGRNSIILKLFNSFQGQKLTKNNKPILKRFFTHGHDEFAEALNDEKVDNIEKEWKSFEEILKKRLRVHYKDWPIGEFVDAIKALNKAEKVGVVVIDYIQLLREDVEPSRKSRQEELKGICLSLKNLAVTTGLPIILGAQFNRQVINYESMSPTNIGEAGDIERIANLLLGIWNGNYKGNHPKEARNVLKPQDGTLYVDVMKGRDIGSGHKMELHFDGNIGKISQKKDKKSHQDKSNGCSNEKRKQKEERAQNLLGF